MRVDRRRRLPSLLRLPLLVTLAALAGCGGKERHSPAAATSPASAYPVVDAAALRKRLEELRGRVVVLNVWATWCTPCATELPELNRFTEEYRRRGVTVLALNVDDPTVRSTAVESFLRDKSPKFEVLLSDARSAEVRSILDGSWDGGLPATFVYERTGRLRTRLDGGQKQEAFAQAVSPLVGGGP